MLYTDQLAETNMLENINEGDSSCTNTRGENETEYIYMNEVPKRSQQMMGNSTTQDTPGGHNHGCYKLAVVFFGLLSVLLLAAVIGLGIKTEETRQLQLSFNNLNEEKDQLDIQYSKLTEQKKQLQVRNSELTAEKSQLETNFSAMSGKRDELHRRRCKLVSESMKQIQRCAVDVTLDPDTANAQLILSAHGKQVRHADTAQNVSDSPKRFSPVVAVLAKEGFTSWPTCYYYEVVVKGKTEWTIGVAKESINRKGSIIYKRQNGYWVIWLRNGTYAALLDKATPISLTNKPQRVGVFVVTISGLVAFYDADTWCHIYSFRGVPFGGKVYPYFCPSPNKNGTNSAPLIITPVSTCEE